MQKLALASLALSLLLSGCSVTRNFKTAGSIEVLPYDENCRFKLMNMTLGDLTNVRLKVQVRQGLVWYFYPTEKLEVWKRAEISNLSQRYNYGIDEIEVRGTSDQGRIKGYWSADVSP